MPSSALRPSATDVLAVEVLDLAGVARHHGAWKALVARALEPNVFLEPDFVLAAAALTASRQPVFLLVWAGPASGARVLLALCPLDRPRLPADPVVSVWFHDFAPLGGMLLDRERADPVLRAILAHLARVRPFGVALIARSMPTDGPGFSLLSGLAAAGHGFAPIERWDRAVLRPIGGSATGGSAATSGWTALSGRRRKELARQRRRLGERGALRYASGPAHAEAIERFLTLEAQGWKGRRGTALLVHRRQADFARSMLLSLGAVGQCRIDTLWLDEAPIAAGIVLSSGGHDFFWKIAYAEALAGFSPGVQLVLDLTEAQHGRGDIRLTDSCAIPDHPMIDRIWRERRPLADVAIALRPGAGRLPFQTLLAVSRLARRLKAWLKSKLHAWRAKRRAAPARTA